MDWEDSEAHSAIYDTRMTAELFCAIVNRWHERIPDRPWLVEDAAPSA
jgi:ribonuclease T